MASKDLEINLPQAGSGYLPKVLFTSDSEKDYLFLFMSRLSWGSN